MNKQQVGLIGLAVMGKNLALNIASHGYSISVYNRSSDKTKALVEEAKSVSNLVGTYSLEEFVASLETPRRIILMVKAGEAVDKTIESLIPLLDKGDLIVDGGNSYYEDTIARSQKLSGLGLEFIGSGVSGGEEGALKGPAIMPGGSKDAYKLIEPILTAISAKVDGEPCCTYIGTDGAGHFVKMVHNGIEYGDMQLICEAYAILKDTLNLSAAEFHEVFASWNQGELSSYLIDITADIFKKIDEKTGKPVVDIILDRALEKGTGKWTSQSALALGIPTPTITEAVFARYISRLKEERVAASKVLNGPKEKVAVDKAEFIEAVRQALFASKICSYAQGFSLLEAASNTFNWDLQLGNIALIFRGGCIIRAQFLNNINEAYGKNKDLKNLLLDDYFKEIMDKYHQSLREVIITGIKNGIPMPAFTSALAYYDSYRSEFLPANLLQAQRDYFGAHTYERIDEDGDFHTIW